MSRPNSTRNTAHRTILSLVLIILCSPPVSGIDIFEAISGNDVGRVQAQVEVLGVDPNAPNSEGSTPLVYALDQASFYSAHNGGNDEKVLDRLIEIVRYLVSAGADVNRVALVRNNRDGFDEHTALTESLYSNDRYLVQFLLDSGANPNLSVRLSPYSKLLHSSGAQSEGGNLSFGKDYLDNPKLKANALDLAVSMWDPLWEKLIRDSSKTIKLTTTPSSLYYFASIDDMKGFKNLLRLGAHPTGYDLAYLTHFSKFPFLEVLRSVFDGTAYYNEAENPYDPIQEGKDASLISSFVEREYQTWLSNPQVFFKSLNEVFLRTPSVKEPVDHRGLFGGSREALYIVTEFLHDRKFKDEYNSKVMEFMLADHYVYFDGLWFHFRQNGEFDWLTEDGKKVSKGSGRLEYQGSGTFLVPGFTSGNNSKFELSWWYRNGVITVSDNHRDYEVLDVQGAKAFQ